MRLTEYINPKCISVDMDVKGKDEAIEFLVGLLLQGGSITAAQKEEVIKTLKKREELGSTGVGYGVGIPHGKCSSIEEIVLAIAVSKKGVDFASLDGKPVHIFFLLLGPEGSPTEHLKALARIARFSKDRNFREKILKAKTPEEVLEIIKERESKELA
ncbi:MAG: PTS sugar transporter subunit IIA [Caldiserica bacterium]|nr:PTS sugar transporter subunit IIA [Caldisericota bacterium]